MGKRRESLVTKRNATSEGPGGQLSAQCLMKNRRGKRGWSGRDMHVPPSAPMALLHVYEAAEPHHGTQPSPSARRGQDRPRDLSLDLSWIDLDRAIFYVDPDRS